MYIDSNVERALYQHLVTLFVRKVLEQTVMEEKYSLFLHTPS